MRCKKIVIWSIVNEVEHPSLTEDERRISAYMPLVSALFPGIDYFSTTGFGEAMRTLVMPVLKKQFAELKSVPQENIPATEMVDVSVFLPSKRYQWGNSRKWQRKFDKLLAAV